MAFDVEQDAYTSLRSIVAERTRPLIVWAGSGLSASAGLPTWPELKQLLVEAASRRAASYNPTDATRTAAEVDQVRRSSDYWVSFQRLRDLLGPASYTQAIRDSLASATTVPVPASYRALWRLPIQGMLTLNIDRLATRAHMLERPDLLPAEVHGTQISRLRSLLFGPQKFIGNLHGVVEDTSTWVFTHDELARTLRDAAYCDFMRNCLADFTNIFVAINPDDRAVGSHLSAIKSLAADNAPSFWVTDRRDRETDTWAEERGIRVIRYNSGRGTHEELDELLDDLANYVPVEDSPAPPVSDLPPSIAKLAAAPTHEFGEEAFILGSSELRVRLNAAAAAILANNSESDYARYEEFSRHNDELIYRAWYTTTRLGSNDLLGFTLEEEVARGAFGRVYRAVSPDGEPVAVKVLLDEVRRDPTLLASFRRGVRSMRILQQSGLKGIVQYRDASEIPAFVAMDWIEGPNLQEAKEARVLDEWSDVLDICTKTTSIIRRAHALPERVLHRDIRPANIMLRDHWADTARLDVVVLDFDLSWHRGAAERSIVFTSASGYLAPEQQVVRPRESTRNAAVDSFGLGMMFYYLISGSDPVPNQQMHRDWAKTVESAAGRLSGASDWSSTPARFSRIIAGATQDAQAARWDLARMENELQLLRSAVIEGKSKSPNLVAEELASRSTLLSRYTWDDDRQAAVFKSPSGLNVELAGDALSNAVRLDVRWSRTGSEDRTGLTKYIRERAGSLGDRLKGPWSVDNQVSDAGSLELTAHLPMGSLRSGLRRISEDLDEALRRVAF